MGNSPLPRAPVATLRSRTPRRLCKIEQTRSAPRTEDVGPAGRGQIAEMNRDHALMNALSAWTVALRCPHCGRTGSGTVSEDAYGGHREPGLRVDRKSV